MLAEPATLQGGWVFAAVPCGARRMTRVRGSRSSGARSGAATSLRNVLPSPPRGWLDAAPMARSGKGPQQAASRCPSPPSTRSQYRTTGAQITHHADAPKGLPRVSLHAHARRSGRDAVPAADQPARPEPLGLAALSGASQPSAAPLNHEGRPASAPTSQPNAPCAQSSTDAPACSPGNVGRGTRATSSAQALIDVG
jgi:hypothetical protein